MTIHTIRGVRDDDGRVSVYFDGRTLDAERSLKVFNHSPDGFEWGYSGSGPAQLALAILLEAGVGERQAVRVHQRFKQDFLAPQLPAGFGLELDVVAWARTEDWESYTQGTLTLA